MASGGLQPRQNFARLRLQPLDLFLIAIHLFIRLPHFREHLIDGFLILAGLVSSHVGTNCLAHTLTSDHILTSLANRSTEADIYVETLHAWIINADYMKSQRSSL